MITEELKNKFDDILNEYDCYDYKMILNPDCFQFLIKENKNDDYKLWEFKIDVVENIKE